MFVSALVCALLTGQSSTDYPPLATKSEGEGRPGVAVGWAGMDSPLLALRGGDGGGVFSTSSPQPLLRFDCPHPGSAGLPPTGEEPHFSDSEAQDASPLERGEGNPETILISAPQGNQSPKTPPKQPKPHPEVQKLIDEATDDKNDWKDMPPLLEKALKKAMALKDMAGEAMALTWIGLTMINIDQPRRAIGYLTSAINLFDKLKHPSGAAPAWSNLGLAYARLSQHAEALTYYRKAEKVFRSARLTSDLATVLSNIGNALTLLGDSSLAIEAFAESLVIRTHLDDIDGQITVLANLGHLYSANGRLRVALDHLNRALKMAESAKQNDAVPAIKNNLGGVWLALGQYRAAISSFDSALEMFRAVKNQSGTAATLNNLGHAWAAEGDQDMALRHYHSALALDIDLGDIRGQAAVLHNIGNVLGDRGDLAGSLDCLTKALPLRLQSGDVQGTGTTLSSLGVLRQRMGDNKEALLLLQRALGYRRRSEDLDGEATTLSNLGFVWQSLAVENASCIFWKLSVNRKQELRYLASGVSNRMEIAYFNKLAATYLLLTNSLTSTGRIAEAMQVQELQEASKIKEFVYRGTPEQDMFQKRLTLTKLEKLWLGKYEEAAKPLGELGKQREELARIKERLPEQEKKLKEIDAKLKEAETNFQKTISDMTEAFKKASPEDNKLEDLAKDRDLTLIAKTLTEKTNKQVGVIATMVGEKSFHVMLLKPDATVVTKEIPVTRADLSKAVTEALQDLNSPSRQPFGSLGKLYDMVVKPFEEDMKGLDCLMFNLNGPLRYVPMAALYDGKSYLAEKYQVSNFSIAVWERLADDAPKTWSPTFFGLTKKVEGFDELPGVKAETEAAAPLFQTTPQLDDAFTQPILEKLLKEKKSNLLHFGTHFALDPASSDETYMLLGDGTKWKPTEMEERKDLSFEGVEMLVASACKTGVPTGDDASIEGFGAYCQVKGAKSVLSTLWEVNDEATGQWMKTFYNLLSQGTGKGEAFHRAQLAMITGEDAKALSLPKAGTRANPSIPSQTGEPDKPFVADPKRPLAHPYYWAPFTLSGNWR